DLLADGVADEATDHELVAEFLALFVHELGDGLIGVLDEGLIDQADGAVEFLDLPVDDLLDDVRRLAGRDLLAIDGALALQRVAGDGAAVDANRIVGGDLQGDVADELLERIRVGRFVLLGPDFHENADFAAGVNVGGNGAVALHFDAVAATDEDVFAD